MSIRNYSMTAGTAMLMAWVCSLPAPAHALTMQECSAKYRAAKTAGNLGGMKWNDFRRAECDADAAAAPASAAPAPAAPATTGVAPSPSRSAPSTWGSPASNLPGNAVFPTSISPKFASESAGKARMYTCLEQYRANKANAGNGSLKWIQKGGGYYSECNRRLSQYQR